MEQMIQKSVQVENSWVTVDVYGAIDESAIVLIPGVLADAAGWAAVAKHLEGWGTVAVVNRRGRRPSGPLTDNYDLEAEVRDAEAVLREFSDVRTVFGWSYGGLIALHLANTVSVPHLIAYEPIMAPFGAAALQDLQTAHDADDLDRMVEVALGQVTGMPDAVIESLRSDSTLWAGMRDLSSPIYRETLSISRAVVPEEFAQNAARIDLIIGERNLGQAPYGTTFNDVARRTSRGVVHELPGQAHLAHMEAPNTLADLVNQLRIASA